MSLPVTMRAAVIDAVGPPEAIHLAEIPVPQPGPGEALIKVSAVAVNHVDTFVRAGSFPTTLAFPFVIGRDAVGEIVQIGPDDADPDDAGADVAGPDDAGADVAGPDDAGPDDGDPGVGGPRVDGPRVGERIWCSSLGYEGRQGPTAEYAVVPFDRAYPAPDGVPDDELVAASHPASTAWLALHVHARLQPGEVVFVAGAAGQVGGMLVRLAARAGARVIGACAARDADYVRRLGADAACDYADPDLPDRVRDHASGGVDVVIDTSARQDPDRLAGLLRRRGRMVALAGMGTNLAVRLGELYPYDRSLIGFAISNAPATELAAAGRALTPLLAERVLGARSITRLPLAAAAEAHAAEERNEHSRLVIIPGW